MSLKNNEPKAKFLLPWPPFSSHQTFLLFHNFFGNWYNIQFGHWVFALKNKTKQNSRFLIINQSQILILCSLKSVGFFFFFISTTFIQTVIFFYLDCWDFNLLSKYLLSIYHVSGTILTAGGKDWILIFLEFIHSSARR